MESILYNHNLAPSDYHLFGYLGGWGGGGCVWSLRGNYDEEALQNAMCYRPQRGERNFYCYMLLLKGRRKLSTYMVIELKNNDVFNNFVVKFSEFSQVKLVSNI
jgi:hypothetical protein